MRSSYSIMQGVLSNNCALFLLDYFHVTGGCDLSGCSNNCQCWTNCQRRGDEEGDSFDQLPFDGDEEEYDSRDIEYDEDVAEEEELDEAVAFAQA